MLAYQITENFKEDQVTLILLHAFPFSSRMWENERKELSSCARILTPDLPGFGSSGRQRKPSIAGMADKVGDLLDFLSIQEPVVIGGLSMGGYVALEFFRRFPSRVRGLMLFSTRATADSTETHKKRFRTIADIERLGLRPFAEKTAPKMLGKTSVIQKPEMIEQVKQSILLSSAVGVTDALRAMANRSDLTDLLSAVSCPTLILTGDEDIIVPPQEAYAMEDKIPAAVVYTIPKAGHLLNLERPEIFVMLIETFLATEIYGHSKQELIQTKIA